MHQKSEEQFKRVETRKARENASKSMEEEKENALYEFDEELTDTKSITTH
jgi:hypothetical protein